MNNKEGILKELTDCKISIDAAIAFVSAIPDNVRSPALTINDSYTDVALYWRSGVEFVKGPDHSLVNEKQYLTVACNPDMTISYFYRDNETKKSGSKLDFSDRIIPQELLSIIENIR